MRTASAPWHLPCAGPPARWKRSFVRPSIHASAGLDLVVFTLDAHRYGLLAERVSEVVRAVAVARLPQAPDIVEGVINVRGALIAVVNVRRRFGLPDRPLHPTQHMIVTRAGPRRLALRVDRAHEITSVDPGSVTPVDRVSPGVRHVSGIARLPDGLIIIQDLEAFLSLDESQRFDAALSARNDG